ncbi:MAG: hypothetical protein KJ655_03090, partial [Candidatus Thermoplasmatota archaeon]|nr:hypothetical protein [Candidatus Thermoplasmatota archaeon]
ITYDDYLKIFINETIEYNETRFVINYTDDEKPRIENVRFISNGEEINEIVQYEEIWVECSAEDNNIIENLILFYNDGSGWESKEMLDTGEGYRAYLGAFDRDVEVYINVTDLSGNTYQSQTYILKTEKEQPPNHLIFYVFLMMILIGAVIVLILRKVFK